VVEVKYNAEENFWSLWIHGEEDLFYSYKSENEALYMKKVLELKLNNI
jgi:hypothetical protein